jgi:hypothetical protein
MSSWQNVKLAKCQVANWQVGKMASWQNDPALKANERES